MLKSTFSEDTGISVGVIAIEHLKPIDDFIGVIVDTLPDIFLLLFEEILEPELFRDGNACDLEIVAIILHDDIIEVNEFFHELESNVFCQLL